MELKTVPYITMRDGAPLHIRTIGRGKPFVLMHGFGMDSRHWLPFAWHLRHEAQFILPDFRGFGHSKNTPLNQQNVFSNFAEDIEDVLNHYGIAQTHLAGLSMGAYTGLQMQKLGMFDRVHAYAHMDQAPCALHKPDWPYGLFGAEHGVRAPSMAALSEKLSAYKSAKKLNDIPKHLRKSLWFELSKFCEHAAGNPAHRFLLGSSTRHELIARQMLPSDNVETYINIMNAYLHEDHDMRPSLKGCKTPLEVWVGMRSTMYAPAGQIHIKELVPHAKIVRFTRSGHSLNLEQPLKFSRELQRFLQG